MKSNVLCIGDFKQLEEKKEKGEISIQEFNKIFTESRFHGLAGDIYPFAIGGSDASIVLGLNEWKTPLDLFKSKLKLKKDKPFSPAQERRLEMGHQYEDAVRNMFGFHNKIKVSPCTLQFKNIKYPNLVANIDGYVYEEDENGNLIKGLYEGKTTKYGSKRYKEFINNEVPVEYWIQIQFYLTVLELPFAYICCAWGFDPETQFKHIRIEHNKVIGKEICEICQEFVNYAKEGGLPTNDNVQDLKLRILSQLKINGVPKINVPALKLKSNDKILFKELEKYDAEIKKLKADLELAILPKENEISKIKKEFVNRIEQLETRKDEIFYSIYKRMNNSEALAIVDDENDKYMLSVKDGGFSFDQSVKDYFKEKYPFVWEDISTQKPKPPKFTYRKIL